MKTKNQKRKKLKKTIISYPYDLSYIKELAKEAIKEFKNKEIIIAKMLKKLLKK